MAYSSMEYLEQFIFASITVIAIALSTPVLSAFAPISINSGSVCAAGQPLDLIPVDSVYTGSCVPASARCAFACQQNALNCTCFNYYANGSCDLFSGSSVNVSYQQGCTLWAVSIHSACHDTCMIYARDLSVVK